MKQPLLDYIWALEKEGSAFSRAVILNVHINAQSVLKTNIHQITVTCFGKHLKLKKNMSKYLHGFAPLPFAQCVAITGKEGTGTPKLHAGMIIAIRSAHV